MPIVLPTERSRPTADPSRQTILVYGPPKIGKSTFASRFPEAVFLECEPGLGQLEVFKVPTYSWEALLDACRQIASGGHRFKTVVIDTADNAFKLCSDHVCAKHSIDYEGDMAHGKGWALVKNEWHRVLTRLASLPYGLVLISHAVDKTIETRTGEYTKTQPSLPDRARGVVLGLVDMILFCDTVTRKDASGQIVVDRIIRTKPHPTYEAGDRTGRLPDMLPLDYDTFLKAFSPTPGNPAPGSPAPGSSTPGSSAPGHSSSGGTASRAHIAGNTVVNSQSSTTPNNNGKGQK